MSFQKHAADAAAPAFTVIAENIDEWVGRLAAVPPDEAAHKVVRNALRTARTPELDKHRPECQQLLTHLSDQHRQRLGLPPRSGSGKPFRFGAST